METKAIKSIISVYKALLNEYGPQGWWPLTRKGSLIPEHRGEKPDSEKKRFEIIIGAILTQNTAWKNVEKAIANLNKEGVLSKEKIRILSEKELAELIRPSGYYNQKARKIKEVIKFLDSKKEIKKEMNRKNLLSLWGIGPETADSILLYAYEQPFFVVDAYTRRISSRLGWCEENVSYEELQGLFHKSFSTLEEKEKVKVFKEYHALLVEHAKRHCRKNPLSTLCEKCLLRRKCKYAGIHYT